MRPRRPGEAAVQRGWELLFQGRFDEAIGQLEAAVRREPDDVACAGALGQALGMIGDPQRGAAVCEAALAQAPGHRALHVWRAFNLLKLGDYRRGWPELEWRLPSPRQFLSPRPAPEWDGRPLRGRWILLHHEQGLGDLIQFVRYVSLVKERGGKVMVACPDRLGPLISTCPGVDRVVPRFGAGVRQRYAFQASLLSLPAILGTTLETVPAAVPYLHPEAGRLSRWRRRLGADSRFKIGVAWQGSTRDRYESQRSFPLRALAPLARLPGVALYSLQQGPGSEQLAQLREFPVATLGDGVDAQAAFVDTAAIMRSLDLVVTLDSSPAHLAGALGVPVWMALSALSAHCWMLERQDSPWYPSMRIFRQQKLGDWGPLFETMAQELAERVSRQTGARRITVEVSAGELLDKITILELKRRHMSDPRQLEHVGAELAALADSRGALGPMSPATAALERQLASVNAELWQIEDDIRGCERARRFGARFVALARRVYRTNDRRAEIKKQLNLALGSRLVEEKHYRA